VDNNFDRKSLIFLENQIPTELQVIDQKISTGFPAVIAEAGSSAQFAYEEFFFARIRNPHTRRAYQHAVHCFLDCARQHGLSLTGISPRHVGEYLSRLAGSIATRKLHLAALRHFFDELVTRHAVLLNPAASVRGERYQVVEGKTPEIGVGPARALLASIDTTRLVGLRDRAVIGVLIYTAARVGAVAKLNRQHFYENDAQYCLHFDDKGGKSREIPVRHDLQRFIFEYLDSANLRDAENSAPLFRTASRRTNTLTANRMRAADIARMIRRRVAVAGLPSRISPHSFRVTTITDLLIQGVPLGDVQYLAGHADPRTTRLYDRRQKKVTRNIVERISI
jgi:site-specific recombinase XerD